MNCVKVEDALYCYIKDEDELNQILEKEKPEYSYDLIERHRKDFIQFDTKGFYNVSYDIVNPCEHGFYVVKKTKNEIIDLIAMLQKFIESNLISGEKNVSDSPA